VTSLLPVHTYTTDGRTLFFIKQFLRKLFLHFSPTVADGSYDPMKREKGKGSACSSLLGVKELVIIQAAAVQSIIQLHEFIIWFLLITLYVLIHNKYFNQHGLFPVLFKYIMQAICTIFAYADFAKFTILC
jgi:hypothetical protein